MGGLHIIIIWHSCFKIIFEPLAKENGCCRSLLVEHKLIVKYINIDWFAFIIIYKCAVKCAYCMNQFVNNYPS